MVYDPSGRFQENILRLPIGATTSDSGYEFAGRVLLVFFGVWGFNQ